MLKVPKDTPFLGPNGTLNRTWLLYFEAAQQTSTVATSSGTANSYLVDVTATGPTTINGPAATPPADGDTCTVRIKQDGTGGRVITWAAEFNTLGVELSTAPNTTSIVRFTWFSADSKWVRSSLALTGLV